MSTRTLWIISGVSLLLFANSVVLAYETALARACQSEISAPLIRAPATPYKVRPTGYIERAP